MEDVTKHALMDIMDHSVLAGLAILLHSLMMVDVSVRNLESNSFRYQRGTLSIHFYQKQIWYYCFVLTSR